LRADGKPAANNAGLDNLLCNARLRATKTDECDRGQGMTPLYREVDAMDERG
jgi:hypothetical protein